jgi:hypothetical protein
VLKSLVATKDGRAIICGMCCLEQNLFPREQITALQEVIPTCIHYDWKADYDSMLRIKSMADIVIASHDSKYMFVDRIG